MPVISTEIIAALIGAAVAEHVALLKWLNTVAERSTRADTRTQVLCEHILGTDPAQESEYAPAD